METVGQTTTRFKSCPNWGHICDRCHNEVNGYVSGFEEQHGEKWCVDCCLKENLNIPFAIPSSKYTRPLSEASASVNWHGQQLMFCDKCKREDATATFGGHGFPSGEAWCSDCANAAGIPIPSSTPSVGSSLQLNEFTQQKMRAYNAKKERRKAKAKDTIPFDQLEPEAVLIIRPDDGEDMKKVITRVRNALWHFGQTPGYTLRKHKTKVFPEENCIRVWRLK